MNRKKFLQSEQKKTDATIYVERARKMAAILDEREISASRTRTWPDGRRAHPSRVQPRGASSRPAPANSGFRHRGRWSSPRRLVSKKANANQVRHTNPEITS